MCFKKKIALSLPYPEEKPDYNKTIENTDIEDIRTKFYHDYEIKDWDFWDTVEIIISNQYGVPACTYQKEKQIYVRPEWYNHGVLAHECAHISHYLLSDEGKKEFEIKFNEALLTDKLVKYLDSVNSYMNTSFIEGHAEIFRYLGTQTPENLKIYYPKLF
jgi:hypothetical protein